MNTEVKAFPGIDVEKMEGFNAFAAENPNEVLLGLEARTIWEGKGGNSLAKVGPWKLAEKTIVKRSRDYSIQFGAWKEVEEAIGVEGPTDRLEPVEVALSSLCGCITWAICINAALEGVSYDELEVVARAEVDPRVLLGIVPIEESKSCLQTIEVDVHVKGDLNEDDLARLRNMAGRSPVHAMVSHENQIITRIHKN